MTDMEYAKRWAETRTNDLDAHRELFAASRFFAIDSRTVADHNDDTITNDEEFAEGMAHYANKDTANGVGVQTFTVTDVFPGNGHLMIHFDWKLEHADTFYGLPTKGRTLSCRGSAFLDFDDNGKIEMESSYLEDPKLFEQIDVPLIRPHYWDADFDPASLG